MLLNIFLFCILLCSASVICGIVIYRDLFIKLLFLNTGTSLASLFICLLGSYQVNNSYIDIALIYFLLSTIATSAYLKYFLQKSTRNKDAS